MLKINNTSLVPPGGWKYTDPDTGAQFSRTTYMSMVGVIHKHRAGNQLPQLSEARIQQVLCRSAYPGVCSGEDEVVEEPEAEKYPVLPTISGDDVVRGTKVIWNLIKAKFKGGDSLVSPEEAERRARICSDCPKNVEHDKENCKACIARLATLAKKIVSGGITTVDENLKTCSVCHCSNKAQVWVPYEHLKKGMTPAMESEWPDVCWKNPQNNV